MFRSIGFFKKGFIKYKILRYKSNIAKSEKTPTGIVFMNMGGPSTIKEVHEFLFKLFSDSDLMQFGKFQNTLAKFVSYYRTPKIEKHYREIGGGSPIKYWSEYQCEKVCKILDKINPKTSPHKSYIAFRYANPLTEYTIQKMIKDGVKRGVAFSQYPQFSYSTSASSMNELYRQTLKHDPNRTIHWTFIDRWPKNEGLINAFVSNINEKIQEFNNNNDNDKDDDKIVILFSAHSLPMEIVNKGDSYPSEVSATVYAIMEKLNFNCPYRLVWQSKIGPKSWLGGQTSTIVKKLESRNDIKGIILVPVAFTSDHIETLYELDIELIKECKNPNKIRRIKSLNDNKIFLNGLANLVKDHLSSGENYSKQLELDCILGDDNSIDTFKHPNELFGNHYKS